MKRRQVIFWRTNICLPIILICLPALIRGGMVSISELKQCQRDRAFDRAVNDNVSPWTVHLYNCKNMDPNFYWSVECRRGSCINPLTMHALDNYTIMPIKKWKIYLNRTTGKRERAYVTVACKCVPDAYVDDNNAFA
ncbi:uncharacterized protein LOC120342946 [Styela clava]|uniref:uncharacterized protein LOC120342946 n=1 Tax=Styela clava TaxID=7725 RepID=UPI0019392F31|nr:uncharacterized protein LOC120342946 [Styela clava]